MLLYYKIPHFLGNIDFINDVDNNQILTFTYNINVNVLLFDTSVI